MSTVNATDDDDLAPITYWLRTVVQKPPPSSPSAASQRRERRAKSPSLCPYKNCCLHGPRELRRSEEIEDNETDNPYANIDTLNMVNKEESYIRKKHKPPVDSQRKLYNRSSSRRDEKSGPPTLCRSPSSSRTAPESPLLVKHSTASCRERIARSPSCHYENCRLHHALEQQQQNQDSKATSSSAQLSSSVTSLPFTEDAPSIKQSSSRVVEKKTWKLKPDDQDLSDVFIGVMRAQDAGRRVKLNDFRLYYRSKSGDLQVRIPLFIAYKNSMGHVYHFPVVSRRDKDDMLIWHVDSGDPKTPSFDSLMSLIKYHRVYSYFDPTTGRVDAFPVWNNIDVPDSQ
ncbi:Protein C16A11.7 [Aphelenchoides avenae]|nr:Protein C16A11.7 [Aphelenchus avenae]